MLRPRIIPCLLVHNKGLVKTVKFKDPKYVGDPINAVKIFNEKEVDELIVIDIDATVQNKEPNFEMIKNLAVECRMPFCYGGGVKTVEHARKIINLGAEKVAISASAIENSNLVSDIAQAVGSQSVVVILDVKKKILGGYEVYTHNAKKGTGKSPIELAKQFEALGAGEIVLNSIDNDGVMKGYDITIIDKIREATSLPITILGGVGSLQDIEKAISRYGIIGVAAGSLFVFKGVYKAVLINYPNKEDKDKIIGENFKN
ncbi:AglZ/HisF2 family acetamidino modification protein [Emticicia sp.]|uniref:AglZ/HisF2 family acetamidino modification protein n=1 Tax=Emticicia sp. TaxID=1930953 RepID=UPI0037536B52